MQCLLHVDHYNYQDQKYITKIFSELLKPDKFIPHRHKHLNPKKLKAREIVSNNMSILHIQFF